MIRELLSFLFPAQCADCCEIGSGLCERCFASTLPPHVRRLPTLDVRALGAYEGALKRAVIALKDGRRDVAQALGERCATLIAHGASIVPVPTTAVRRRERGIDGVIEIARVIAMQRESSVLAVLEQRRGDAQRGRSRRDRLGAHGRFACTQRLDGRRMILLDDVCTTGATLEDCAATIREAGGLVEEAVIVALA